MSVGDLHVAETLLGYFAGPGVYKSSRCQGCAERKKPQDQRSRAMLREREMEGHLAAQP